MRNNDVGNDLKAVAQDVMQMGARCVQAGRDWLNERRSEMTDRNNEDRPDNQNPYRPGQRQQPKGQGGQQYGRQPGSQAGRQHHAAEGSGSGGYQGSYGGSAGRQQGEGYGSSSGYGSPDSDRYGDSSYQGTAFVSPGDTQQSHAGMGRQSYSGKGPKNYTRSDERVTEDICERLTLDPDIDASDIEVKVAQGTATLEGTVSQRWMKHRAEDVADACSGVRNVENRIRVQPPTGAAYGEPTTQRSAGGRVDPLTGGSGESSGGTAH